MVLAVIIEYIKGILTLPEAVIRFILIMIFYCLAYKSLKNLYYEYWTFVAVFFVYVLFSLFSLVMSANWQIAEIYLLTLIVLSAKSYWLLSPIYYPRVRWWIYDFRYRGDLVIRVKPQGQTPVLNKAGNDNLLIGRLTDLRRKAGCILLFNRFEVGEKIYFYADSRDSEIRLLAEVISVREYTYGRGYTHGVRFIIEDYEDLRTFNDFVNYWEEENLEKIMQEFEEDQIGEENGEYIDFEEGLSKRN